MAEESILIVDDDRTIVRLCQRLLERASYQVITALDPLDALKILERQKVDLLLSDIRMPVMDGFEMISHAKQFQPDLPVLVMTGYGSIDNAIQALHRGVDGLILKPFENTAELIQAVQRVLDETRQRRDAARLQALRPLFDVTERLLTETTPQTLEKRILSAVTGMFQAGFAGIFRLNEQLSIIEVIRRTDAGTKFDQYSNEHSRNEIYQLVYKLLKDDLPAVLNISGPGNSETAQKLLEELNWETLLLAPVRRNESHFLLCASRERGNPPFTEADLEMFVILARQAAVAMENARLYSELKDYVRRVEESQRALIQAEKMAAVGRLMASLAHEINNPLQSVRNCLHLAGRKGLDNDQRFHYLEMTDGELDRLVSTVRRMLDFYRPGGADRERVNVQQIIDQVMALIKPQLRDQGIQVHFQSSGRVAPVDVVKDQIQQVFFNLLLNSMDALDENATENGGPKEIWIDTCYEECQVCIRIEDSGLGIPEELREQIFEPFVSTKAHGTGLGLAVSYGIMERHQGGLTIIPSRYGNGACFEIVLPLDIEGENG